MHLLVSRVQLAEQPRMPEAYPWLLQVWLFRLEPSHFSWPSILPSPQKLTRVHFEVSNWHLESQARTPPL